jgi:hypothetical protein
MTRPEARSEWSRRRAVVVMLVAILVLGAGALPAAAADDWQLRFVVQFLLPSF